MRHLKNAIPQYQGLPLSHKLVLTRSRIEQFYIFTGGNMFVSLSGKDSTATLHIVREMFPDTPAVYVDTGLEYPEIVDHVKSVENVIILKPKMRFHQVVEKYGYPVVSKEQAQYIREARTTRSEKLLAKRLGRGSGCISLKWRYLLDAPFKISEQCCSVMKHKPMEEFIKQTGLFPITGIMAENSRLRMQSVLRHGCNGFEMSTPQSRPIAMWKDEDVWQYIRLNNVKYSRIYDMGYTRTGCMFCLFGLHLEKEPNRFDLMMSTHPKRYEFCMNKLGLRDVMRWYPKRDAQDHFDFKEEVA